MARSSRNQSVEQTLNVEQLDSNPRRVTLEVALQGVTHTPHLIAITLNGLYVGQVFRSAGRHAAGRLQAACVSTQEGQNQVT